MMAFILFPLKAALEKKIQADQIRLHMKDASAVMECELCPASMRLSELLADGDEWKPELETPNAPQISCCNAGKIQLNPWRMDAIMLTWTDGDDLELFGSSLQHLDV